MFITKTQLSAIHDLAHYCYFGDNKAIAKKAALVLKAIERDYRKTHGE